MTVRQEFQAVVLAAGKGSRMPELTAEKPKCLLPIGGKPMVWYPLLKLQKSGFTEVIVIVCESQKIEIQTSLEKTDLDIKIDYFTIPSNDEMGTADSLRLLHDRLKSDVLVMSCDLITNVDLGEVFQLFRRHDASVCSLLFHPAPSEQTVVPGPKAKHKPERDLIGVDAQTNRLVFLASASDFEVEVTLPKALVKKHTNITMYNNLIDSHLYVLKNWVIKYLQHEINITTLKGEFLPKIIKKQLSKPAMNLETNASIVKPNDENDIFHFIKCNQLSNMISDANSFNDHRGDLKPAYHGDLIRCYAHVAKPDCFGIRVNTLPSYWSTNKKLANSWELITQGKQLSMVDPRATVNSNQVESTFVWDQVVLNEKTSFKNSVVGSNSKVCSFSRVFDSIVMNNVTIKEKVVLENCIVCDGAVIESGSKLKSCLVGTNHTVSEGAEHNNEVLTDTDNLMEF